MSDQGFPAASTIPAGSVVITPVQMYEEMRTTHEVVQRIETLLSPMPAQIADHEARVRKLEQFVWKASGVAVVVGIAAGAASGYFTR